jgi:hypothetical protein
VSETLESELSRFERVLSAFEKHLEDTTSDLKNGNVNSQGEDKLWKDSMENSMQSKFTDVHNAVKLLNNNILKNETDAQDRAEL